MKKRYQVLGMALAALAVLMIVGCVGTSEKEVAAQKAKMQDLTERIAGLETQMKRLSGDVDEMMIVMGNQQEMAGGVSPELARRIDTIAMSVQKLENEMGEVQGLKSTVQSIQKTASPRPAAAPATQPTTESKPKVSGVYHKVQKGETLTSIARKYEVTIASIRRENNLPSNALIRTGAKLYIPRAQ